MADTGIKMQFGSVGASFDTFTNGVIFHTSGPSGVQFLHLTDKEFAALESAVDWVRRMRQDRAEMRELVGSQP